MLLCRDDITIQVIFFGHAAEGKGKGKKRPRKRGSGNNSIENF